MCKYIKGYKGLYTISELCEIVYLKTGNVLKPYDNGSGYKKVDLFIAGKRKKFYVHRLGAIAFIPNPLNRKYINHIDGNPSNNELSNLEWCTHSYNVKHGYDIGLHKPTRGVGSKFTEAQIKKVRDFKKSGKHRKDVYKMYSEKCTFGSFENIWYGYVWKKNSRNITGV